MAATIDYARQRDRDRVARQGHEPATGGLPPPAARPRLRPSKARDRAELVEAVAAITATVECSSCGHAARLPIPPARRGRRLRCGHCGGIGQAVEGGTGHA